MKSGESVPIGDMAISGISADNSTTDCQVFVDWNDLKPFQRAIATGPGGSTDYSSWKFTYTPAYHLISDGSNELTSKLSCLDDQGYLAKWYSVNVTGSQDLVENTSQVASSLGQENQTNNYQDTVFRSLKVSIPTDSEAKTLIEKRIVTPTITDERLRKVLQSFLRFGTLSKPQLTSDEIRLLQALPNVINQPFTPERKLQLELFAPLLANTYPQLSTFISSNSLDKGLNSLSATEKLSLVELLIGLAAIYMSAIYKGTVTSEESNVISKVVSRMLEKYLLGGTRGVKALNL